MPIPAIVIGYMGDRPGACNIPAPACGPEDPPHQLSHLGVHWRHEFSLLYAFVLRETNYEVPVLWPCTGGKHKHPPPTLRFVPTEIILHMDTAEKHIKPIEILN